MRFLDTAIAGVFILDAEPQHDERGAFTRVFDAGVFRERGLVADFRQHSMSINGRRGTLRGVLFQYEPHSETKLVRCTAGAVFDVAVDIRKESPSFGKWISVELSAKNQRALYL